MNSHKHTQTHAHTHTQHTQTNKARVSVQHTYHTDMHTLFFDEEADRERDVPCEMNRSGLSSPLQLL